MYALPEKKFRVQTPEEIERQIKQVAAAGTGVESIFLGDGDAMTLSVRRLEQILDWINEYLPQVKQVSSYCLPRNLKGKSVEDLTRLRKKGLGIMYVGCESGDDEVLAWVKKGETFDSSLEALKKIKAAGLQSSVMIINGLGGTRYSRQHAENSARLMTAAQPDSIWLLVLGFPMGRERFEAGYQGQFEELNRQQLLQEMAVLLEGMELDNSFFRSDHASNYLPMQGYLGRDKTEMLRTLHAAIEGIVPVRQEWQRAW
jgi:radical SAM superfamily enzyme YgiQ (UPF0313 family)